MKKYIILLTLVLCFYTTEAFEWYNMSPPTASNYYDLKIFNGKDLLVISVASNSFVFMNDNLEVANWREMGRAIYNKVFPSRIVLLDSHLIIGSYGQGLYKTRWSIYTEWHDGYEIEWDLINKGFSRNVVNSKGDTVIDNPSVSALETDGKNLYAGTLAYGFYISTDGGDTWVKRIKGLPSAEEARDDNIWIKSISVVDTTLYICLDFVELGKGVYKSTNYGESWEPSHYGLNPATLVKSITTSNGEVYAAGTNMDDSGKGIVYMLQDENEWVDISGDLPPTTVVSSIAAKDKHLVIGTREGFIYLSTNKGKNWTRIDQDKMPRKIEAIAISEDYLFACPQFVPQYDGDKYVPMYLHRAKLSEIEMSVTDSNIPSFCIYPNPAGDYINISIDNEAGLLTREIQILNLLGLVVTKSNLTDGNNRIDISDLPQGTYFIKLGDKVEKFLKM